LFKVVDLRADIFCRRDVGAAKSIWGAEAIGLSRYLPPSLVGYVPFGGQVAG